MTSESDVPIKRATAVFGLIFLAGAVAVVVGTWAVVENAPTLVVYGVGIGTYIGIAAPGYAYVNRSERWTNAE